MTGIGALLARLRPSSRDAMPPLDGATAWLNSPPLTTAQLRGKVVLVQFWTYSCIEWLRTYPFLSAWADKYRDHGLVVIGVHTPEYSFEHDIDNVRKAVLGLGLRYPIAIDNHRAIAEAFKNPYSPGLYIVDARGRIRQRIFGEAGYEDAERPIQQLLREAGAKDVSGDLVRLGRDDADADVEGVSR